MQCLYLAGTTTECLLRRGARLWEVKNAVLVGSQEHDQVSAHERCPTTGVVW